MPALLHERGIHVALIQETQFKSIFNLRNFRVSGYSYTHCDCLARVAAGSDDARLRSCQGIAVLVKTNIMATVGDPVWFGDTHAIDVSVFLKGSAALCRNIYLSPAPGKQKLNVGTFDESRPTIVAGDFNEAESGKAVSFLEQRGLSSVLTEFHPGANTWRWNTPVGSVSAQLDHITYDQTLTPLNAYVVREGRSDHFPVVAVFAQAP